MEGNISYYYPNQYGYTYCSNISDGSSSNGSTNDNGWELLPSEKVEVLDSVDDILKVFQDLDISLNAKKKNNILIIQNVNIKQEEDLYKKILDEIKNLGGMRNFLEKIYLESVRHSSGNKSEASRMLGVSVRTIRNYKE